MHGQGLVISVRKQVRVGAVDLAEQGPSIVFPRLRDSRSREAMLVSAR